MGLEIVSASELTLRKSFFERAVIAKTWSDVSPIGEERLVESAASNISANSNSAKSAALIALAARKDAVTILVAAFNVKLPRKFNRGFGRFRTAGSEIDAATVAKIRRSHREQTLGKFFRRSRVKLRSVRES